jgi:uncharacterized membrane protein YphA (DoxX/SURF4 family)
MTNKGIYKFITYCIAAVWLVNGLFCKVLDLVPRHQEIVKSITNVDGASAAYLTILIGLAEIVMAVWILSGYQSKINAILQILIVATMNILEFTLVPDLLLWGKLNSLFAFLFIGLVYFNEFYWHKRTMQQP